MGNAIGAPCLAAAYGTWAGTKFYKYPGGPEIPFKQRHNGGPYVWVPPLDKKGDFCKYKVISVEPEQVAWAKCDSINRNDFGGV